MTTETRGSWELHEAVVSHWVDSGLDDRFRDEWIDGTDATYEPLNDTEARPEPPGPYCVYTISEPNTIGHSSGTDAETERQYLEYTLTFVVHAKSDSVSSGKRRCKDLAKKIAEAFDPKNALPVCNDAWISTERGPDVSQRLGDEEWGWSLTFTVKIDAVYDLPA